MCLSTTVLLIYDMSSFFVGHGGLGLTLTAERMRAMVLNQYIIDSGVLMVMIILHNISMYYAFFIFKEGSSTTRN